MVNPTCHWVMEAYKKRKQDEGILLLTPQRSMDVVQQFDANDVVVVVRDIRFLHQR